MFEMKNFPSWVNADGNKASRTKGIKGIINRRRNSKTDGTQSPRASDIQQNTTEITNSQKIEPEQIPMNKYTALDSGGDSSLHFQMYLFVEFRLFSISDAYGEIEIEIP